MGVGSGPWILKIDIFLLQYLVGKTNFITVGLKNDFSYYL